MKSIRVYVTGNDNSERIATAFLVSSALKNRGVMVTNTDANGTVVTDEALEQVARSITVGVTEAKSVAIVAGPGFSKDRRKMTAREFFGHAFQAATALLSVLSAAILFMFISGNVPQAVQHALSPEHEWAAQAEVCHSGVRYVIFSNGNYATSQMSYDAKTDLPILCKDETH